MVLGKGGGEGRGKGDNEGGGGKGRAERESVKLGDVASVVARGRNVGVLVGEKDVRLEFPYCYKQSPSPPSSPRPSRISSWNRRSRKR